MPNAALERFPQLRRITNAGAVRRLIAIARRRRLVTAPGAFVLGELRGGTRSYRLAADPGRAVVLRHRTRDMEIFDEIFRPPGQYTQPPGVTDALAGIDARRPLRVLDLGGNVGLFGVDVLSRYPTAQITSYEPEPANLAVLERCAAENADGRWEVVQACAMAQEGTVHITPGEAADAHVAASGVPVPAVDVLPALASYDFVKIDIEGSEWPILLDERWAASMRTVSAMVMEWHERGCPLPDAREAAQDAVRAAGFELKSSPAGWPHGIVWGWRG